MDIYPREDIKNGLGDILWHKDKKYECSEYTRIRPSQGSKRHQKSEHYYIVTCELISNEYPLMTLDEIKVKFYTTQDLRDKNIKNILNKFGLYYKI